MVNVVFEHCLVVNVLRLRLVPTKCSISTLIRTLTRTSILRKASWGLRTQKDHFQQAPLLLSCGGACKANKSPLSHSVVSFICPVESPCCAAVMLCSLIRLERSHAAPWSSGQWPYVTFSWETVSSNLELSTRSFFYIFPIVTEALAHDNG